ncbi:MAG: DUF3592 domain-containing protein [Candidatus Electrothrix sp. EH2]|nr:DUF3592 domain-containing protein [Candidatus Electrothrix sp. EH2]
MVVWVVIAIVVVIVIAVLIGTQSTTDAKIRSKGVRTTGKVIKCDTQTTHGAYGAVYKTHYVTYEYEDADGKMYSAKKQVSSLAGMTEGSAITVYYLPDRPGRNALER